MSTFLQLVQDLHRESGAAGVAPTSVTGQTGEALRLVNWLKSANDHINDMWINWKFLRSEYNQPTVQSQPTLPAPTNLLTWDIDTFQIIEPGGSLTEDRFEFDAVEYSAVKTEIIDQTEGTPNRVIIMPDNSLKFDGVPDGAYEVFADYYRVPATLTNNTDEPEIPAAFRQVILGYALILYANFEGANEIKAQGQEIYARFITRLENHQLPNQNYSRYRTDGGFEVIASQ